MEESFTIHLGSQMKSTHNIRIMSADTLNLLSLTLEENGYLIFIIILCDMQIKLLIIIILYFFRTVVHHPQRLQTVLELYSQDLKGLVLFIDTNNLDFYSGLAKGNIIIILN